MSENAVEPVSITYMMKMLILSVTVRNPKGMGNTPCSKITADAGRDDHEED